MQSTRLDASRCPAESITENSKKQLWGELRWMGESSPLAAELTRPSVCVGIRRPANYQQSEEERMSPIKKLAGLGFALTTVLLVTTTRLRAQQVPDPDFKPKIEKAAFAEGKGPVVLVDEA